MLRLCTDIFIQADSKLLNLCCIIRGKTNEELLLPRSFGEASFSASAVQASASERINGQETRMRAECIWPCSSRISLPFLWLDDNDNRIILPLNLPCGHQNYLCAVLTLPLTTNIFLMVSVTLMMFRNSIRVLLSFATWRCCYQSPHILCHLYRCSIALSA